MADSSGFSVNVSEIRRPSAQYKLDVKWWTTVRDLKEYLSTRTGEHINGHHLYFESGTELNGDSTLHDLGINKSGVSFSLLLDTQIANQSLSESGFISPFDTSHLDHKTDELVRLVKAGFDAEKVPTKPSDAEGGTAGVYFMKGDDDQRVAVFKPHDEEQGMPNNPKNRTGNGAYGAAMRDHFKPGYGCIREWATYVMDVGNFAGVPPTLLVNCEHRVFSGTGQSSEDPATAWAPKFGSLQMFIPKCEGSDEYSWSLYSDLTVQKSALLDLRTLNCDRNSENLLVKGGPSAGERLGAAQLKEMLSLVPIDHGYALPSVLRICQMDWTWMTHPQVRMPLCPEIKAYLAGLSFDEVASVIRPHLPEECIYLLQAAHWLVTMAAVADLTLYEMANLVARDDLDPDKPSRLEEALHTATENSYRALEIKGARRLLGKGWGSQSLGSGVQAKAEEDASGADSGVGAVPAPEVVQERMQRSRRGSNSPLDSYGRSGDTRLRRINSTAVRSSASDWRSLGFSPSLRSSPTVVGTPVLVRTKSAMVDANTGTPDNVSTSSSCSLLEAERTPSTRVVLGGGGLVRMSAIGGLESRGEDTNNCNSAVSSLTHGYTSDTTSMESADGQAGVKGMEGGEGMQLPPVNGKGSAVEGLYVSLVGSPRGRLGAPAAPPQAAATSAPAPALGGLAQVSPLVTSAYSIPWANRLSSASAPTSPMMNTDVVPEHQHDEEQQQQLQPRQLEGEEQQQQQQQLGGNNNADAGAAGNRLGRFVVLQRQSKVITRIPSAESFFSESVREGDDDDSNDDDDDDGDGDDDDADGDQKAKHPSKGDNTERSPREVRYFADGPLDAPATDLTWRSFDAEGVVVPGVHLGGADENASVDTCATTVEAASVESGGLEPPSAASGGFENALGRGSLSGLASVSKASVTSPRMAAVKLSRVVSFNGFDAAPLDDLFGAGKNSRIERRRELSLTEEFKKLRLRNTEEAIRLMVIKAAQRVLREGRRSI